MALCPELDIASQGDDVEEARRNLLEALELFFKTASPHGGSGTASHPSICDLAGNIGWVDCVFYLAEKPVVFWNSTVSGKLGGGAITLSCNIKRRILPELCWFQTTGSYVSAHYYL